MKFAEGIPWGYFEGGWGMGNALLVWFMNGWLPLTRGDEDMV
jgi:hypothetical protein